MPLQAIAPGTVSDRELVLERTVDAPRRSVFEAWTDPEQLSAWWGPAGFRMTTRAIDPRPGGLWVYSMRGPDGIDHVNRIEYVEIVAPRRLVYLHGAQRGGPPQGRVTVLFDEEAGTTHLTLRLLFPSALAREATARSGGLDGSRQSLERLDRHLRALR